MSDTFFILGLLFIIVFSCLSYGSVTAVPLSVIQSIVGLLFFAWLIEMAYKRRLSLARIPSLWPLLLFILVVIFQLIPLPLQLIKLLSSRTAYLYETLIPQGASKAFFPLSIFADATFGELLKVITYLALFVLVVNRLEKKKQIDMVINAIILFGLLISIYAVAKKLAYLRDPESVPGSFGPFVSRNNFAGYINMIIPLALGYFLTDIPLSRRIFYGFCIGVMSLALFWTLSRGGVLVYLAALNFIVLLGFFKESLRRKMILMIVWIVITLGIFIAFLEFSIVWQRLSTLFQKETFVVLGHGYPWTDILGIWRDFPVFGTGLGTFGSISAMYKSTLLQGLFVYAHNDYLQLLSETGLIGTLCLMAFFLIYFKETLSIWFGRHNHYVICMVLGGMASIFGMLAYSFLDFNLHVPANALLFFIIMGIVYRLSFIKSEHDESGELA